MRKLFDDFWHAELVSGYVWSVIEESLTLKSWAGDVLTDAVEYWRCVGSWLDALDIKLGELVDVAEDVFELLLEGCSLFRGEFESGEIRHVVDVDVFRCHAGTVYGSACRVKF